MSDEELRNMITRTLTCRIDKRYSLVQYSLKYLMQMYDCPALIVIFRENCDDKMTQFLKRCFYHSGQYDSEDHFSELNCKLKEKEVLTSLSDL